MNLIIICNNSADSDGNFISQPTKLRGIRPDIFIFIERRVSFTMEDKEPCMILKIRLHKSLSEKNSSIDLNSLSKCSFHFSRIPNTV